jgi:membrane associated rhomboid family serine protease
MSLGTRYRTSASLFYRSFPRGVKWLIIANVAVYLVYFFGSLINGAPIFRSLQLVPYDVIHGEIWQLGTYLFLHSLASPWHIVLNMLMLWMFGSSVEETWGTERFLRYYFICGVGAGICVVVANLAFGNPLSPVIGASGAIYGLLLAFGMLFPEQEILLMFLFPIKAKYFVMIAAGMVFLGSFSLSGPVSDLAHLGGMVVGYIYFRTQFSSRRRPALRTANASFSLPAAWREYKLQRAKKKFQVYMKKHGSDKGPWVN